MAKAPADAEFLQRPIESNSCNVRVSSTITVGRKDGDQAGLKDENRQSPTSRNEIAQCALTQSPCHGYVRHTSTYVEMTLHLAFSMAPFDLLRDVGQYPKAPRRQGPHK